MTLSYRYLASMGALYSYKILIIYQIGVNYIKFFIPKKVTALLNSPLLFLKPRKILFLDPYEQRKMENMHPCWYLVCCYDVTRSWVKIKKVINKIPQHLHFCNCHQLILKNFLPHQPQHVRCQISATHFTCN